MSDGHLAEVQAELEIEKRTRDEVLALNSEKNYTYDYLTRNF